MIQCQADIMNKCYHIYAFVQQKFQIGKHVLLSNPFGNSCFFIFLSLQHPQSLPVAYTATTLRETLQFLRECVSSGMIKSLNKGQFAQTVGHDDVWFFACTTIYNLQFHLLNFAHIAWNNQCYGFQSLSRGTVHWDHLTRSIVARNHLHD